MTEGKLFAGGRLRRFRKGLGLTQTQMAEELGVSPSYLTLIERDQRPISARMLLALAESYDLDLRAFGADADERLVARLKEVAADPVLDGFDLDPAELRELAEKSPRVAEAMTRLHAAHREAMTEVAGLMERVTGGGEAVRAPADLPVEEVRDALHANDNYYPDLEEAAARFLADEALEDGAMYVALAKRLRERHGVTTKILPFDVMGGALRRFDRHARRLSLSELLDPSARVFQIAVQLATLEEGARLDALADAAPLSSREARQLYRVGLANYLAGAVMMPYDAFREAAEAVRYDIDVLARRFSASFEQVCHRLTTLRRPGARGVPFLMIRVDQAGNVSKRFGGRIFHFARSGGACPRWNLYDAFRTPDRVLTQLLEMPDGERFFSVARAVKRPGAGPDAPGDLLAVGLGCEAAHAHKLVYADGLTLDADAATPIGINCRLCERPACPQRAHPPLRRRLHVDDHHRGVSPFAFRVD